MKLFPRQKWLGYVGPASGIVTAALCFRQLAPGVNTTTVALSFLLVVLLAATAHGIGPGILTSVLGMLCFNFFFLPPVGTLTIYDPQNWVALFAFLVTAVIASQLSSAARNRAREAEESREQVWKLYQLSRAIIVTPDPETAVSTISRQVAETFDLGNCEVCLPDPDGEFHRIAAVLQPANVEASRVLLQAVFQSGETRLDAEHQATYAPLKMGLRVTGVMVLTPSILSGGTIEAISGLVALALERARFLKELGRTEALRHSDQLKSALLASVSHDLRTPLTSIRAAVDNLLEKNLDWDREVLREFHLIISEEVNRLTRLVHNLLEMARIEAGEVRPAREWGSITEIFSNVLDRCATEISNHRIQVECEESLPLVKVDSRLLASVIANLLENAAKYSPAQSEIVLHAGIEKGTLQISVQDQGPGVPAHELSRVFDKFYRGTGLSMKAKDGTGMGLAIARGIVEAHGGRIWVENLPRSGATFIFTVPVETKPASKSLTTVGDER